MTMRWMRWMIRIKMIWMCTIDTISITISISISIKIIIFTITIIAMVIDPSL